MTSPSEAYVESRSAIETDWECGMKYWWSQLEGGRGISPVEQETYFTDGTEAHAGLEGVARLADPSDFLGLLPAAPSEPDQIAFEKWSRLCGWIASFAMFIEPGIREEEEFVSVEHEVTLDRHPYYLGVIPDRIGRGRESGRLRYREWKTTSATDTKNFADYWPHAVQLHLGLQAVEEELGEEVEWGQVMGLLKGKEGRDGKLAHPYVWAWWKGGEWLTEYAYKAEKVPVWEYPGGVAEWVRRLGPGVAAEVFPRSRRVYRDPRLIDALVAQRKQRVISIASVRELAQKSWEDRVLWFEQRFTRCRPMYGSPCAYREACWNASVNVDPVGSGLYVPRVPHHELEAMIIAQREER